MNKKLLYILLSVIAIEGFLIICVATAHNITLEELSESRLNATSTQAYRMAYDEALAINKEINEQNDELRALNKKVGEANVSMADAMKKYCPAGLLMEVKPE